MGVEQRCKCGWVGKKETLFSCPACNKFLSRPKGTKVSNDPRKKTTKGRSKLSHDDGFRLRQDPTGKGWNFVEGKEPLASAAYLSASDSRKINACLVRRGLYRSRKFFRNSA